MINFLKKIDKFIFFSFFYKFYRKIINLKTLKIYKTKTGNYYLPKYAFKDIIRNEIINNKIFDENILNASKNYIEDNSIILDAGANYGQMSILLSKLKKNLQVYSFESSQFIFQILKKNIQINEANCIPINCVLGNEDNKSYNIKKINLDNFNTYGSNKVVIVNDKIQDKTENVIALKIDSLNYNKKISFFKIDVQGFDLEVLKGARKTIAMHKMPIIFEYEKLFEKDLNYNFRLYENFIEEINYKIVYETKNNYLILPK